MSKELGKVPEWQQQAREEAGIEDSIGMNMIPVVKVYNKPMSRSASEDITKTGKIIIRRPGEDWTVLGEEMNLNILLVRKFYTGFVPRINEFGDFIKDSNGNPIKDFYYTPEVEVYSKDNIPLGVQYKGGNRTVIGRASKEDFDTYCKSPKIDGAINPLFKEVKTNMDTGERYTTSHMKLGYVIYVQDLDTNDIYKVIPGGSYGRFNDVQPGTFEDLKNKAAVDYKKIYNDRVMESFIKTKVSVKHDNGFYFLDWKLDGFQLEDNRSVVQEIRDIISEFNQFRFTGIDFDQPLQSLPYTSGLAIEAPKEEVKEAKKETKKEDDGISISDVPFS